MALSPSEYTHHQMIRTSSLDQRQNSYSLNHKSITGMSDEDINSNMEERLSKILSKYSGNQVPHSESQQPDKSLLLKIVQNIYFQIFITFLTIVTLFLYDLKTIFLTKSQDFTVGVANLVFFGIFIIEILMNTKNQGYFCSFSFYLDIISTITILFDVDMITDALFNQTSSSSFQVNSLIAKSKASRAAARAVRVVKIFRLARVAKLYKQTQRAKELNQQRLKETRLQMLIRSTIGNEYTNKQMTNSVWKLNASCRKESRRQFQDIFVVEKDTIKEQQEVKCQDNIRSPNGGQKSELSLSKIKQFTFQSFLCHSSSKKEIQVDQSVKYKESNISRILLDDTMKKIIIVVLILMVSIPLTDITNYLNVTTQWDYMISFMVKMLYNQNITLTQINLLIQSNINQFPSLGVYSDLLCIDTPFDSISNCYVSELDNYRTDDIGLFYQSFNVSQVLAIRPELSLRSNFMLDQTAEQIVIFVSYQSYNKMDSIFSIITTILVCLTILYLLTSFSNNINKLIISPIQKMLQLVRSREQHQEEEDKQGEDNQEEYQTKMVQNAIIKIKNLMETIFGHLGNQIVQSKLQNGSSFSQTLDQNMGKSLCIFVLCKINHFTAITDILRDEMIGFVNEISTIVQNSAFRYGGYCTKILDNGFLLIFKIPQEQLILNRIEEDMNPCLISKEVDPEQNTYIKILSDYSVFSALKILARLCKEPKVFRYRKDQRLLVKFQGSFNIEMNIALNLGWASEGIIGSSYKIDPIFYGSEINRLSNLIKFSQGKGHSIVVGESLYSNMSEGVKSYCREFQSVRFEGAQASETVYTVDFDMMSVTPSRNGGKKSNKKSKDLKIKKQVNMAYLLTFEMENYNAMNFINDKKELRQILKRTLREEARKKYKLAFQKYVNGQWEECLQLLQYQKLASDAPSQRLRAFIKGFDGNAPSGWDGYREFDSIF